MPAKLAGWRWLAAGPLISLLGPWAMSFSGSAAQRHLRSHHAPRSCIRSSSLDSSRHHGAARQRFARRAASPSQSPASRDLQPTPRRISLRGVTARTPGLEREHLPPSSWTTGD